jgi:hypothetical protein
VVTLQVVMVSMMTQNAVIKSRPCLTPSWCRLVEGILVRRAALVRLEPSRSPANGAPKGRVGGGVWVQIRSVVAGQRSAHVAALSRVSL